jgi:hypothetical protein
MAGAEEREGGLQEIGWMARTLGCSSGGSWVGAVTEAAKGVTVC